MPLTDLRMCIKFKLLNQINPILEMKVFTKPNCNFCMEKRLTILKIFIIKYYTYEQNIKNIRGLPEQKISSYILPPHK